MYTALDAMMSNAYKIITDISKTQGIDIRMAAYVHSVMNIWGVEKASG